MSVKNPGIGSQALKALSKIEPNEQKATFVSALTIFILMAAYYVMKAVRDSMASDWSNTEISQLWNINFFVSTALVAIWGLVVTRVKLRAAIPTLYVFFSASFLVFWFGISLIEDRNLVDKAYYVWVSCFALFHVTAFWMCMADTFSKEQSKRLFGVIMIGMSGGTLVGPTLGIAAGEHVGNDTLMLITAIALLIVIPLLSYLYRLKSTELGNEHVAADTSAAVLGGQWWKGFQAFASNPYLLGIGGFILLYVFVGSFFYFEQTRLLGDFSREERRLILNSVDLIVNLLTYGLAFFLTGRIVTRIGMPFALAIVPILMAVCFVILAFAPILTVFPRHAGIAPGRKLRIDPAGKGDALYARLAGREVQGQARRRHRCVPGW